tara:strand:- start:2522 stop:2818 length:297 start_codon:yes stop_codon:yes gene_type:complete
MSWQTILKKEITSFSGMARLTDVLEDHEEIQNSLSHIRRKLTGILHSIDNIAGDTEINETINDLLGSIKDLKTTIQMMDDSYQEEQGMAWGMLQEDNE